jgi:hypothetical protein
MLFNQHQPNNPTTTTTIMTSAPTKMALLIGIDQYDNFKPALTGAINDIVLAETTLKKAGFEDIICLRGDGSTNPQPTRENIIGAFNALISKVKASPGGIVAIHYSGHGSFITNSEKTTGQKETIVPCDSGRGSKPSTDIVDDDIRSLLQQIAAYAAHVVVIFDSCHSESATRNPNLRARTVEGDKPAHSSDTKNQSPDEKVKSQEHNYRPFLDNVVVIAACSYDHYAYETRLEEKTMGLLSYYWYTALDKHLNAATPAVLTYADLFDQVFSEFMKEDIVSYQKPSIEGDKTWGLFGASKMDTQSFAIVLQHDKDGVTLDVGLAHGVTKNSSFHIYSPLVRVPNGSPTAIANVSHVSGTTLRAALKLAVPTNLTGYRAFEAARPGIIKIHLPQHFPQLSHDLIRNYYQEETEEGADLKVSVMEGKSVVGKVEINAEKPSYVVVNRNNEVVLPLAEVANEEHKPVLARNLVAYTRYQLHLNNMNDTSPLFADIEFTLQSALGLAGVNANDWTWTVANEKEILVGSYLRFTVKQTTQYNKLYFAIIGFDEMGAIGQYYPENYAAAEPLMKNQTFVVPAGKSYGPLTLDKTIPRESGAPVPSYFKLYVSTEPTSFMYITTTGYRQQRVLSTTPATLGAITDWTCKKISYFIREK